MSSIEPFPGLTRHEAATAGADALPDGIRLIETPEGRGFINERRIRLLQTMPFLGSSISYAPDALTPLVGILRPPEAICLRLRFTPRAAAAGIGFSVTAAADDPMRALQRGEELAFALDQAVAGAFPGFSVAADSETPSPALSHTISLTPEGISLPLARTDMLDDLPRLRVVADRHGDVEQQPSLLLPPPARPLEGLGTAIRLLSALDFPVEVEVALRRIPFDAARLRQLWQVRARLTDRSLEEFAEKAQLPLLELGGTEYLTALVRDRQGYEIAVTLHAQQPLGEVIGSTLCRALLGARADIAPCHAEFDLRRLYPAQRFHHDMLPLVLTLVPAALANQKPTRLLPRHGLHMGRCADGTELRLTEDDRTQHTYMIGATGTGKSTEIASMAMQDMADGKGVILIDPHGDLWEAVRKRVPKRRQKDVVLVHLGAPDAYPFTMNILAGQGGDPAIERHTITNSLIEIFKRVLYQNVPEAFGPMFEVYFRNALMLLMTADGDQATIMDFERVFDNRRSLSEEEKRANHNAEKERWKDADGNGLPTSPYRARSFRERLLKRCNDKHISDFWAMAEEVGGEASLRNIAPYIVCKLTQITGSPLLAPVLGARDSSLDFGDIIRHGKICLINLAKGHVGAKDAAFAGGLMTVRLAMAALAQARVPEAERHFVSVYLDEFQTYATDLLSDAMAELRKYRIALTLANQTLSQIDGRGYKADARDSILGNAANLVAFRVGVPDAEILARWFQPQFSAEDLAQLPNYTAIARPLAEGRPLPPIPFTTLPPARS